jgi:hypothetical protein
VCVCVCVCVETGLGVEFVVLWVDVCIVTAYESMNSCYKGSTKRHAIVNHRRSCLLIF